MKYLLFIALLASAGPTFAQTVKPTCTDPGDCDAVIIKSPIASVTVTNCVTMYGVLELCSDPPTIWMSPDVQPRETAERFLDALKSMGYRGIERNQP